MSGGERLPLLQATVAAEDVAELLAPACERLEVAGSIRRGAETIGDIELVAVPRMVTEVVPDGLWGAKEVVHHLLRERVEELVADGRLWPHPEDPKLGDRYAKLVEPESGLQVDLFMVLPPAQFGVILLIRTGSAAYSQWFVSAVRGKGWHVSEGALHRGGLGCTLTPCEVAATPDEADVYRLTGIPFAKPHLRGAG